MGSLDSAALRRCARLIQRRGVSGRKRTNEATKEKPDGGKLIKPALAWLNGVKNRGIDLRASKMNNKINYQYAQKPKHQNRKMHDACELYENSQGTIKPKNSTIPLTERSWKAKKAN